MPAQRNPQFVGVLRALGLIGLAFCFAACGLAQGGGISGQVISPAGYPVAFGFVRICPTTSSGTPCSPLTANVYADPALTIPVANPYATDSFGNYSVFVAAGSYYIVQVSFTSNQQPYTYAYIEAAASSSVAAAAPQYSIPVYTTPGTGATLGESYVDPTNGQLRTDSAGGLYVAGGAHFYGSLTGTTLTGATFNATGTYEVNGTQIAAANLLNGVTGTGAIVLANTPTLITPVLGAATGTSLVLSGNGQAQIFNAISGFEVNGVALASTNLSDSANLARLNAANVFTAAQTIPNITGPTTVSGALKAGSLSGTGTPTFAPQSASGTGAALGCQGGAVCDSVGGTVELVTGTGTSTGLALTVTWPTARVNNPNCLVSFQNLFSATNYYWAGLYLALSVYTTTPMSASTTYVFTYVCEGY